MVVAALRTEVVSAPERPPARIIVIFRPAHAMWSEIEIDWPAISLRSEAPSCAALSDAEVSALPPLPARSATRGEIEHARRPRCGCRIRRALCGECITNFAPAMTPRVAVTKRCGRRAALPMPTAEAGEQVAARLPDRVVHRHLRVCGDGAGGQGEDQRKCGLQRSVRGGIALEERTCEVGWGTCCFGKPGMPSKSTCHARVLCKNE